MMNTKIVVYLVLVTCALGGLMLLLMTCATDEDELFEAEAPGRYASVSDRASLDVMTAALTNLWKRAR